MKLKIKKLIPDLDLRYHSDGASGIDIVSPHEIYPHSNGPTFIDCGFCVEIPFGYEGQVRPRSGLSKQGILVAFGTIDSDYRGSIIVQIRYSPEDDIEYDQKKNEQKRKFMTISRAIKKGERIAQLVICPVQRCDIEFVDELSETKRGIGGFGSTGK